jgi:hypothetical protein
VIYAIQAGESGPIKFGVTESLKCRLEALQTGNPRKLRVLAAVNMPHEYERTIHGWLKEERVSGEWFDGPKAADLVRDLRVRQKCSDHVWPADDEYLFWDMALACGGSCAVI